MTEIKKGIFNQTFHTNEMKKNILLFLIMVYNVGHTFCQLSSATSKTIDSLIIEDQRWRHLASKVYKGEVDTIDIIKVQKKVQETDSLNYILIKDLFEKHGYLGYNQVGKKSSHNFWLLVQHADKHPDFQLEVLKKMKVETEKQNSSKKDYAYLIDRVKINSGELQIYGTQMELNATETSYQTKPVIDPENLNKRRDSVGLSPIEIYVTMMNENFLKRSE